MGDAQRRGTYEERKAQAIARKANQPAELDEAELRRAWEWHHRTVELQAGLMAAVARALKK